MAKILLITENVELNQRITHALNELKHQVIEVFDPIETIDKAISVQPELIILDVDLTFNESFELCKSLKKKAATEKIPILVLINKTTVVNKVQDCGASNWLTKPFSIETLSKEISSIFQKHETKTVLLCDDDPEVLITLQKGLEQEGFTVAVARDGREVIKQARRVKPDVLVIDAGIPHLSGVEVCRTVKKDFDLHHIPVIIISGIYNSEIDKDNSLHAGASSFLSKPFQLDELVKEINQFI